MTRDWTAWRAGRLPAIAGYWVYRVVGYPAYRMALVAGRAAFRNPLTSRRVPLSALLAATLG
ncbi:MAG: hypothetical protein ACRD0P_15930, partial [Stackebrandtia sp.]